MIKDAIHSLGANKTEPVIVRAVKALGTFKPVLHQFDLENIVKKPSGAHKPPSSQMDSQNMIEQLLKTDIFSETIPRCHISFPKQKDFLHSSNNSKFMNWLMGHLKS